MKEVLYIILITQLISQVLAQSEPESINPKDLMEKIDRSELEKENEIKIDGIKPKLDIPIIEFNKKIISNNKTTTKVETTSVEAKVAEPHKNSDQVISQKKNKSKKKILIAKRPILLNQIRKNDKIVIHKGVTYIYRMTKSNIVQYKYKGKLPLESTALKTSDENSYYVVDKNKFIADARSTSVITNIASTNSNDNEYVMTSSVEEQRKSIESKLNRGKTINNTLNLNDLLVNDKIYVFGDIQLVVRKLIKTNIMKKYWLIGKINPDSNSVKTLADNKYKIIR